MSSFSNPHHLYLFEMENGRKKLAYGRDPADALDILSMRLTSDEMAAIRTDQCIRIRQKELHKYIAQLG